MKRCSKCKLYLEYELFRKDSSKSDGYYSSCNDCQRKRTGAKKLIDPVYVKCGYCLKIFRCRSQQVRDLKGDSLFCTREHFKKYKSENRKDTHVYSGYRKYIKERDKHQCVVCGNGGIIHVHHIKTRGAGGTDDYKNLISLCPSCHSNKAHGMFAKDYREMFLHYTNKLTVPEFWNEVMEQSNKDNEKLKNALARKARERYKAIQGTAKAESYRLKQKENREKRNLEYKQVHGMNYTTYIEMFRRENGGLSPTQVAYRKQKEYKNKQVNGPR